MVNKVFKLVYILSNLRLSLIPRFFGHGLLTLVPANVGGQHNSLSNTYSQYSKKQEDNDERLLALLLSFVFINKKYFQILDVY